MKRLLIVAGLLAAVSTAAGASSLGIGVSAWDTDQADEDSGVGLRADLDVGGAFSLQLRASFMDSFAAAGAGRVFTIDATPVDLGAAYKFDTGTRATPFVGGGLSYVLFDADVVSSPLPRVDQVRVSDEGGWYAAAGVEAKVAKRLAIYFEGLYRQVKADLEGEGVDSFVRQQVDFAGPAVNLGVAFTW